jgi:putative FmdB family regulatory protein
MPIYQYNCKACTKEYEVFYTSQEAVKREEKKEKCPECGSTKKKKLVSKGTDFILKGKGWARDNYS